MLPLVWCYHVKITNININYLLDNAYFESLGLVMAMAEQVRISNVRLGFDGGRGPVDRYLGIGRLQARPPRLGETRRKWYRKHRNGLSDAFV